MHQHFAVILWQFIYGQNSFKVFDPGCVHLKELPQLQDGPSRDDVVQRFRVRVSYVIPFLSRKMHKISRVGIHNSFKKFLRTTFYLSNHLSSKFVFTNHFLSNFLKNFIRNHLRTKLQFCIHNIKK